MNHERSCPPSVKDKGITPSSSGLEPKLIPRGQGKLCVNIKSTTRKEKRRKTKKERNSIKFKTHKETFQKKGWLQDYLRRHDGFSKSLGPKVAPCPSGNKTFTTKQAFITQDRLTQHQGIFDHEVKSINIERFVRETTEVEAAKMNIGSATSQPERRTPVGQMEVVHGLIQTPEVNDQEELCLNQKSSEKIESRVEETGEMKSVVSQPDPNSTLCIQGSGSHLQSTLSGSNIGALPEDVQEAPVLEVAENINKMLGLLNMFPGRNLVREIRQSLMDKMKELSAPSSNLSALPAQRNQDYLRQAVTSTTPLWGHAREGTIVRSTTWTPHAQGHMQLTPVRFTPLRRDSPSHTYVKMVRPEGGEQILNPVFHQSVRSESRFEPSFQHHLILPENSLHLGTFQSPSEGLQLCKQNRDSLTRCLENRHRTKHNLSVNTDSPQVRWTFALDDSVSHNTHQKKHPANQRMINQGWLPGQPLQDVSSEQPNILEPRVRPMSSRGQQPSFDVLHNIFSYNIHNSPIPKSFGVSPLESRACYGGISSSQSKYKNTFESHRNIFHEDHGTAANRFQLEDPLGLRNLKQHVFSPLGTDMDPPNDFFCTNSLQKWRNINVSNDYTMWSSPSSLREVTSVVGNRDTEWHTGDSWKHQTSHQYSQYGRRPIMMPPTASEQENSFIGLPNRRSQPNEPGDKLSPDTWVYPRMRLY